MSAYYYTDNADINIESGVHGCLMLAPYYGDDYVLTGGADFCGLFIFNCGNAGATISDHALSAIAIAVNGGADDWGSAIKFPAANHVHDMFNFSGDDAAGGMWISDGNSATAGNPDGYIRFVSGGVSHYIWTYTNIT